MRRPDETLLMAVSFVLDEAGHFTPEASAMQYVARLGSEYWQSSGHCSARSRNSSTSRCAPRL
jgi:hypothetical protein